MVLRPMVSTLPGNDTIMVLELWLSSMLWGVIHLRVLAMVKPVISWISFVMQVDIPVELEVPI